MNWTKAGDAWNSDQGFYITKSFLNNYILRNGDDNLGAYGTLKEAQQAADSNDHANQSKH
jgi:hypothetical protein